MRGWRMLSGWFPRHSLRVVLGKRAVSRQAIPAGLTAKRCGLCQNLVFHCEVGFKINLGRLHRLVPQPRAITARSTPACNNPMAIECLRTCGVTCFFRSEGQDMQRGHVFGQQVCKAVWAEAAASNIREKHSVLCLGGSRSHALSTAAVVLASGVQRSLRPCHAAHVCSRTQGHVNAL